MQDIKIEFNEITSVTEIAQMKNNLHSTYIDEDEQSEHEYDDMTNM